eukprot:12561617-Heterocapsa_arctica.AAC.1
MISIHADDLLITALDVIAMEKSLEKHLKVKWGTTVESNWEKYLGRWMKEKCRRCRRVRCARPGGLCTHHLEPGWSRE